MNTMKAIAVLVKELQGEGAREALALLLEEFGEAQDKAQRCADELRAEQGY